MTDEFIKEVAFLLAKEADKNVLVSIIKNIIDSDENYDNSIARYIISECVGKPTITVTNVDLEKLNKFAEEHFTNKYYTYVKGSVELLNVDPVRCKIAISYKYTNNDDDKKEVHQGSTYVYSNDYDILK